MELSEIIKKLRGDKTQAEFAEELGVSKQAVSQWETGSTEPSDKIRAALGIQTQYLLQ